MSKKEDIYVQAEEEELNKPVLYFSEVSREIDHEGDPSLRVLASFADHSAIKANTSDGSQYLIERVKTDDPTDEHTEVNKIVEKGYGVWELNEFHHCDENITLGQLKETAFGDKSYDLLTANCQQATRQVANSHSAFSASNEPAKTLNGTEDSS